MEPVWSLFDLLLPYVPAVIAFGGVVIALFLVRFVLDKRSLVPSAKKFHQQIALLTLTLMGLILVVLTLPLSPELRGQLIGLLGIVLSAGVALSSTTFIGNAMAGIFLRMVKVFKSGEFIEVEGYFGRVTERGLFHTEIQSVQRDLITLPNLFLATHPVIVTRASGTIVFAEVSLGYDVPRERIEELLRQAIEKAGLADGYVQVRELGDYSVNYRAAGLLSNVKNLLTVRSRLRAQMLDALHGGGMEIVSPTFMNTRAFASESHFLPAVPKGRTPRRSVSAHSSPESVIFDKADEAETLERTLELAGLVKEKLEAVRKQAKGASGEELDQLKARTSRLEGTLERMHTKIEELREHID